jgi:hypothetical protein
MQLVTTIAERGCPGFLLGVNEIFTLPRCYETSVENNRLSGQPIGPAVGLDSAVGIATGYGLGVPGIVSRWGG